MMDAVLELLFGPLFTIKYSRRPIASPFENIPGKMIKGPCVVKHPDELFPLRIWRLINADWSAGPRAELPATED